MSQIRQDKRLLFNLSTGWQPIANVGNLLPALATHCQGLATYCQGLAIHCQPTPRQAIRGVVCQLPTILYNNTINHTKGEGPIEGRKIYIPVSIGIFDKTHIQGIGEALWLFLWLIDKTTAETDSQDGKLGVVMYGKVIPSQTIADELCCPARTVRHHLKRLEDGGYIQMEKSTAGQVIYVKKSIKWRGRAEGLSFSQPSRSAKRLNAIDRLFQNTEDDNE